MTRVRVQPREPTRSSIRSAMTSYRPWQLGNDVLYNLCRDNPGHVTDEEIVAKFWLIGRTYSAAIERRKVRGDFEGDEFYTKLLVPAVRKSGLARWLAVLRDDTSNSASLNVEVHRKLTDLLSQIAGMQKRSLASKYLHFHFPSKFYIYDSRAAKALSRLLRHHGRPAYARYDDADRVYGPFYARCEFLRRVIEETIGRAITLRELDCILVYWSDRIEV